MAFSIRSNSARTVLAGLTILASGAVGYMVVSPLVGVDAATPRGSKGTEAAAPPVNPWADVNGRNLVAFVITASDCGWSSQPEAMEAVGKIRSALRGKYKGQYAAVSVIGIGLDEDVEAGWAFFRRIGRGRTGTAFDQVLIGGSWLNEQMVTLRWKEKSPVPFPRQLSL